MPKRPAEWAESRNMSRRRRFKVASLEGAVAQVHVAIPAPERRHVQVLRLQPGEELELFDGNHRAWLARLDPDLSAATLIKPLTESSRERTRVILATAWPKGKRSAMLVEKCVELGVDQIIPLRCARSVVHKDSDGEGVERLRRIAAEAAKQCGRADVPAIGQTMPLLDVVQGLGERAVVVLLDPRAELPLAAMLSRADAGRDWCFLIGPEGGFTATEIGQIRERGVHLARLGQTILRVETAAIAVCALAANLRA